MKKTLKVLTNKYVIATLVFVALIFFLDEYNLMVARRVGRQVRELHAEEAALREAIVQDSLNNAAMLSSLDERERYGRENYYMKRADEDIFVIK
ncbi:MAG: hypothetical protein IJ760_05320 [Bacteroidales bacterium]|nr:hypothetical protein [Bacteroidales bacterium]